MKFLILVNDFLLTCVSVDKMFRLCRETADPAYRLCSVVVLWRFYYGNLFPLMGNFSDKLLIHVNLLDL